MMLPVGVGLLMMVTMADLPSTRACAHRGDSRNAPENTLPAFESAVKKGAHQIEFDLHLSKDGRLVVIHDDTVDRTTNGSGRVEGMTFDAIRALDAGSWFDPKFEGVRIPTFREVLDVIPRYIDCNVHLKNAPGVAEGATKVLLDMARLDHCFLAASKEQAEIARAIAPKIRLCNMSRQGKEWGPYIETTVALGTELIQLVGGTDGLPEAVEKLHEHGVRVNFFEAHTEEKIRRCVGADVDFVLTDDLDTCLRVLAEYGVKPATPPEP